MVHIVFVTKNRYQTIPLTKRERLYSYINGIFDNRKSDLLEINGMSDHVHILVNLHPTEALSELVQTVKGSSSHWMKKEPDFIKFDSWGKGYFAVSVSPTIFESCKGYIKNQETHHGGIGLVNELKELVLKSNMEWYDDDWI